MKRGLKAFGIVIVSAALGAAYVFYLNVTPFPPDAVRVVPFLWLGATGVALFLGGQAITADSRKLVGILSVVLSVPSILCAAVSSLAVLMGD